MPALSDVLTQEDTWVLRLRGCFALRSNHSAQDDECVEVMYRTLPTIVDEEAGQTHQRLRLLGTIDPGPCGSPLDSRTLSSASTENSMKWSKLCRR